MLKAYFKPVEKLTDYLEDYEGTLHTKGVMFVEDRLKECEGNEVVGVQWYRGNMYGIGVKKDDGGVSYFHPSWFKYIRDTNNNRLIFKPKVAYKRDSRFLVNSNVVLDVTNVALIKKEDLQLCECGTVLDTDDTELCSSCLIEHFYAVKTYNYKPYPKFKGEQIKADKENPIWYGIELEVGVNKRHTVAKLVKDSNEGLYLKSDSSIAVGSEGSVEIVSHPYSFTALMDKDSWVSKIDKLDVNHEPQQNGCHIHVSRTAFVDDNHYALLYHLMYELGDIGLANQDIILNLKPKHTILDVIKGEVPFEDIVIKLNNNFYFIPGENGEDILRYKNSELLEKFYEGIEAFKEELDFLVIDTGAGIGESVQSFIRASTDTVVVTVPDPSAIMDAYSMIKYSAKVKERIYLIVNRAKNKKEALEIASKLQNVAKKHLGNIEVEFLGFVERSTLIEEASKRRELVVRDHKSSVVALEIADIVKKLTNSLTKDGEHIKETPSIAVFFKRLLQNI
jgi:flagellar biosynthesis protein FlhG